jgi:Kef-type K+ transport system membrane component KefB
LIFFLQMFVILAACRSCGWLMRRFLRQPQVIGEMIAGVALGPSLLGAFAPEAQLQLFPPESKPALYAVAQTGIALYMFLVGLGFRREEFRANAPGALAVSLSGIAAPFAVAILATPLLMGLPGLFAAGVSRTDATMFLGAAIAITALPVLARLISDRNLSGTPIATQALSAAALGDAVAWCVVALVLASVGASHGSPMRIVASGLVFVALLVFVAPRLAKPLGHMAESEQQAGQPMSATALAAALLFCTLSAWISELVGLHAVFGAFLIGTAMPRGVFAARVRALLEPFTLVFLLPVFFTYSGLNTRLTMVSTTEFLWVAAAILAASIFAKFVACWLAALAAGQENRHAMALGALMNARGLTELIIVNIGLQAGIIGPALFSILVLMAIITTLMASPLFELVYGIRARATGEIPPLQ